MDMLFLRWTLIVAGVGGLLGGIYGWLTYKDEVPDNVIEFPLSAA